VNSPDDRRGPPVPPSRGVPAHSTNGRGTASFSVSIRSPGIPNGPHSKPLTNVAGLRSARVGDDRIVFGVADDERIINVSAIGPRGAVYRDL
jgi:hypothetical protein